MHPEVYPYDVLSMMPRQPPGLPPTKRSKSMRVTRTPHLQLTAKSPAGKNRSLKTSSMQPLDPACQKISLPPSRFELKKNREVKQKSTLTKFGDDRIVIPHAHALFVLLDVNGDQIIDKKEWTVFHELLSAALPDAVRTNQDPGRLDLCCVNADGTVSAREWNQYVDRLKKTCGAHVWNQVGSELINLINAKWEKQRQQANNKTTREHDVLACIEDKGNDWMNPRADGLVEFSQLQKDVLQRYFEMRDIDSSGALSLQEVRLVIDDIGRFPEHGTQDAKTLQALMAMADKDHSGGLEFKEFAGFLQAYYRSVYERIFHEHAGKDKQVMVSNIRPLLIGLCAAGFEISCDDLEAMASRDADGILDFEEFCVLMRAYRDIEFEHLSKTAGFREAQAEVLLSMFNQADANGNGFVGIKESVSLIEKVQGNLLDQPEMLKNFARLFLRMDKDDTMSMDFQEFLSLLAVWTKEWNRKKKKVDGSQSSFACGKKKEDIEKAKKDARTFRIVSMCADFRHAEDLPKQVKTLRLAALGEDLESEVLALRWSLPISEVRALREAFEFIDLNGSGEVERGELNRLLGFLGWQTTTGLQKKALAKCLDEAKKKGDLDFVGVIGVVQSYQAAVIQTIFEANANDDCSVPIESITKMFHQAGRYLSNDQVYALLWECDIDYILLRNEVSKEMFTKMIQSQNAKRSQDWQTSWGFSDDEVKRFHRICIEHGLSDEDGLEIDKVCSALEDMLFKGVAKAFRDTMMKSFMRTACKIEGMMSFEEVLLVARHLCNRRNWEDSKVGKALGLAAEAVDQLREVFDEADKDKSGSVSYKEIKSVLSELGVVTTHRQRKTMNLIAQDVLGHEIKDDEDELSFGQFLRILDQFENEN